VITVLCATNVRYCPPTDVTVATLLTLTVAPGVLPTMVTVTWPTSRDRVTDGVTKEIPGGFAKVTVTMSVVVNGVAVRRITTVAGTPTVMAAGAAATVTALCWLTADKRPVPERM
jgi:hypothetical protein